MSMLVRSLSPLWLVGEREEEDNTHEDYYQESLARQRYHFHFLLNLVPFCNTLINNAVC